MHIKSGTFEIVSLFFIMSDETKPKGEHKPLFSIQVDDIIIQHIFKSLEDQIRTLKFDVENLQVQMKDKSDKNEVVELKNAVNYVKEKTFTFTDKVDTTIESFQKHLNSAIKEAKDFVQDQVSDGIMSVNNVVRAQNALIEEKVFQLSKPAVEVTHAIADVDRIKQENKDIRDKFAGINQIISAFVGEDFNSQNLKTLPQIIIETIQPEIDSIQNLEIKSTKLDNRLKTCEQSIYKMVGSTDILLPISTKAPKHSFHEKPKLPKLTEVNSYTDYFEYIAKFVPILQRILSSFYHQVVSISNTVYDQVERNTAQEELEKSMRQITDMVADIRELKENQSQVDKLSSKVDDVIIQQDSLGDLSAQLTELKESMITKNDVNCQIDQAIADLTQKIDHMKTELNDKFQQELQQQLQQNKTRTRQAVIPSFVTAASRQKKIHGASPRDGHSLDSARSVPLNIPTNPNFDSSSNFDQTFSGDVSMDFEQNSVSNDQNANSEMMDRLQFSIRNPKQSSGNSSSNNSARIKKPDLVHPQKSSDALTAIQPRGRASYRMIYGDNIGDGNRSSASSSTTSTTSALQSRINNMGITIRRQEDIEERGRTPKRTQRSANPIQISSDGLPEEKDDTYYLFDL